MVVLLLECLRELIDVVDSSLDVVDLFYTVVYIEGDQVPQDMFIVFHSRGTCRTKTSIRSHIGSLKRSSRR